MDVYEQYMPMYIELVQQCGENTDLQIELTGTLVYLSTDQWDTILTKDQNFL